MTPVTPRSRLAAALLLLPAVACVYDLDQIRGRAAADDAGAEGPPDVAVAQPDSGAKPIDAAADASVAGGDSRDVAAAIPGLPEVFPDRPNAQLDALRSNTVGAANLVAYWPLDEGAGNFVWDVTGNGNDGAFIFDPMWRAVGFPAATFPNKAEVQFDGMDDLLEFSLQTIPDIDKPKSISLWARYDYEVDQNIPMALLVLLNRKTPAGVRIEFRNGRLAATTYFYNEIVGLPAPPIGWHHVVYTFDGNIHTLYLDGGTVVKPVTSMVPAEIGPVIAPDGRCRIGRSSSTVPDGFRGFIDDVRIYNRALTAQEVLSLHRGSP
jgi:hypothetical protein